MITRPFSTPNEWGLPPHRRYTGVVWHTLEGSANSAVSWWEQSNAASAHMIVCKDGQVWLTVEPANVAWHAGTNADNARTPFWANHNANAWMLGIECEGYANESRTVAQIEGILRIRNWAEKAYGIPRIRAHDSMIGHAAHADISNQRSDPGQLFPWTILLAP